MSTPETLFFKVNIKTYKDDGLLAALGAERLHTLIALATFMDEDGHCYPSQQLLSKLLGISVNQVNKRIKDLVSFQWDGYPIIEVEKSRNDKGRFDNNRYFIPPWSGLTIFKS